MHRSINSYREDNSIILVLKCIDLFLKKEIKLTIFKITLFALIGYFQFSVKRKHLTNSDLCLSNQCFYRQMYYCLIQNHIYDYDRLGRWIN